MSIAAWIAALFFGMFVATGYFLAIAMREASLAYQETDEALARSDTLKRALRESDARASRLEAELLPHRKAALGANGFTLAKDVVQS